MKEKLLEDKNKIINIMLNLNKKKEETIISKNKNLPLKRRADEEPEESQNIKYENFDYKIKKNPWNVKKYYNKISKDNIKYPNINNYINKYIINNIKEFNNQKKIKRNLKKKKNSKSKETKIIIIQKKEIMLRILKYLMIKIKIKLIGK